MIVELNSTIGCDINRLPPLNALKAFEAAARRGSFQAAAEELFVTPSAVSHQIKGLEAFLDLELFIRQTRRIVLTQAGEDYFKSVQKALLEIDRSTQKLISSHKSGQLHLGVAAAFLTRWLLPRLSSFHEQNPEVDIELSVIEGLIDFDASETDMAVYFGFGDWQGVEAHFLRHYRQAPICNPRLIEKHPIETPDDLLAHTLLHVTKRQHEWPAWFQHVKVPFKERVKGISFSNGSLVAAAARNGLGIGLADVGFVSEEIASGQLVAPLTQSFKLDRSFYLVYQKNRVMTFAMKAFQNWLMEEMEKDNQLSQREA